MLAPDEPTIAEAPSEPLSSPPTLRPSATTVRPAPRRLRAGSLIAGFFWGSLAVAFGASSAAVWWELNVEPHDLSASAPEPITRPPRPISWVRAAAPTELSSSGNAPPLAATARAPHERDGAAEDTSAGGADTAPADITACARRYFVPGSFGPDHGLDYVCSDTDLRNVKERVHRDVVGHANGAKTKALVSWGTLGWYQLPLLATVRHACCTQEQRATRLPQQHGPCDGLGSSIDALATRALACGTDELAAQGREFAGRAQCLHREERANAFGYTFGPSQPNREEFERLVCDAGQPPG